MNFTNCGVLAAFVSKIGASFLIQNFSVLVLEFSHNSADIKAAPEPPYPSVDGIITVHDAYQKTAILYVLQLIKVQVHRYGNEIISIPKLQKEWMEISEGPSTPLVFLDVWEQ